MHVEAYASPANSLHPAHSTLRIDQICDRGDLDVLVAARREHDAQTRTLGDGGVVGELVAECATMGAENSIKAERLGCLRAPQVRSVDRCRDGSLLVAAFQRVVDLHRGDGAFRGIQALQAGIDDGGRHERPRRVMDEHDIGGDILQTFQAHPDGILPRSPTCYRIEKHQPVDGSSILRRIIGVDDTTNRIDLGVPKKRLDRPPEHGLAAEQSVLLRAPAYTGPAAGSNDQGCSLHTDVLSSRGSEPSPEACANVTGAGRQAKVPVAHRLHQHLAICRCQV